MRPLWALSAVALWACAAAPAYAEGPWLPAQTLGQGNVPAGAISPSGEAVLVGEAGNAPGQPSGAVVAYLIPPDAGPVRSLRLTGDGQRPDVAMNAAGEVAIAWITTDRSQVVVSTRSAAGLSPPAAVATGEMMWGVQVAIDEPGNVYLVWKERRDDQYPVQMAFRPAGSAAFDAGRPVSPDHYQLGALLAPTPTGAALFFDGVPEAARGSEGLRVFAVAVDRKGRLSAPIPVSRQHQADLVAVESNKRGDVLVSWTGVVNGGPLFAALMRAGQPVGPANAVASDRPAGGRSGVALGSEGETLAVWPAPPIPVTAYRPPGAAGFDAAVELPERFSLGWQPAVGFDSQGNGIVIGNDAERVVAWPRFRAGGFGEPETIDRDGDISNQLLLFDASGDGLAAWVSRSRGLVMARYEGALRGLPVVYRPELARPAVRASARRRTRRRELRFGLSEPARFRVTIEVRGKRCNKPPRSKRRRCGRVFATRTRSGRAGQNRVRLSLKVSKRLAKKRAFRIVIRVRDRQGRRATRIVKLRGLKLLRS